MKIIFNTVLIAILTFLVHIYAPFWWLVVFAGFLISFAFGENTWKSFLSGFLAVFLVWIGISFYSSFKNDFILVERISNMLKLPQSSLLYLITATIGGVLGGFSSLTGYYLKTLKD